MPEWIGRLQAMALEWLARRPGDVARQPGLERVPSVASGMRPGRGRLAIAPRSPESVMRPWLASRGREHHFALLRSIAHRR